jgi:hypothetical protein
MRDEFPVGVGIECALFWDVILHKQLTKVLEEIIASTSPI